ncbi:DUF2336 domain-containing protein [Sneathiella sp.]|jgi:uncharacterized protein (DUF2336 family)|uniref:DUF2336 domain-containing protein n=1 Tax=Sneathiella sp. TaxID=1964365 RepID=UPI0039E618C4
MLKKLFGKKKKQEVSYEDSKGLARDENPKVRAKLASSASVRPEVLYYLTDDNSPEVRRNVARNTNTPVQANTILATDTDDQVRSELARKICKILPDISGTDADSIREQTIEILEVLASDQLPSVRAILSESLKDTLEAPKHVIMALAKDVEEIVASPVLEYSPLLTEADLLEVIASGVAAGALPAIARRPNIGEDVSDAVAASLEIPAVAALLANSSARVREDTLDQIISQAETVEDLHEPMVMRVDLSIRAMRRIAGFVASSLVDKLVERNDLSPDIEKELKKSVKGRIEEVENFDEPREDDGQVRAEKLWATGRLDEKTLTEAVASKDLSFVHNGLALMTGLSVGVIRRILNSRNGKVVTSLCWRAKLSMRLAIRIQTEIAHVPNTKLVNAKDGVEYPFDEKEMDWQLSFYVEE